MKAVTPAEWAPTSEDGSFVFAVLDDVIIIVAFDEDTYPPLVLALTPWEFICDDKDVGICGGICGGICDGG